MRVDRQCQSVRCYRSRWSAVAVGAEVVRSNLPETAALPSVGRLSAAWRWCDRVAEISSGTAETESQSWMLAVSVNRQVEQAVFASLKIISENAEAAGEMRSTPSWVEGINEALSVVDPRVWTQGGSAAER
jgi:hypothetical protein